MRMLAFIASLMVVVMTATFAIKASDPALYLKLSLTFDVLGLNPNAKAEKMRLDQIDLLPISEEKKEILANRTIFLGASTSMVRLALGEPLDQIETKGEGTGASLTRWVYHFQQDLTPTALEFTDDVLTSTFYVTAR
jgi:hypothetical protein